MNKPKFLASFSLHEKTMFFTESLRTYARLIRRLVVHNISGETHPVVEHECMPTRRPPLV